MNCSNCGQPLKPGARFCNSCGASVVEAPAAGAAPGVDQTLIASSSSMPIANVDKTIALPQNQVPPPPQPSGPPQQGGFGQPQPGFGPPPQSQPLNQPQPGFGPPPQQGGFNQPQPGYGPPPQSGFNQPQPGFGPPPQQNYPPQPFAQGGPGQYQVPGAGAVPATNGRIPAIIMLVSSLAMIAALFLPLLVSGTIEISAFDVLTEGAEQGMTSEDGYGIYASLPVAALIGLGASAMAFIKRRNLWGVFALLAGLYLAGLNALLLIGASASGSDIETGIAVLIYCFGGLTLLVSSIVFMARKKR